MQNSISKRASLIETRNLKKAAALLVSLAIPPIGLVLSVWLFINAKKQGISAYKKWAFILLAVSTVGAAGYALVYSRYSEQEGRTYSTTESQSDIIVCLDGMQTITITDASPYNFDIGDSEASGRITPTLARVFIQNNNGNFEIGVGNNKGTHHFSEGECSDAE